VTIGFVPLTRDDLPLLARWFEEPHVRQWWLDANSDPDHLEEKYGPRIDGAWPEVFVVHVDGKRDLEAAPVLVGSDEI
jgi:aminoglycoside 6'-N-acetyltransferase